MENKWDRRFLELAKHISTWSKDRSTKVGAIIVDDDRRIISLGYNGIPMGLDDEVDHRHQRPEKYLYFEHAERNAIYTAARNGISLKGTTIYLCWFPCEACTRAIIQSGIKAIVCTSPETDHERWGDKFKASLEMLDESGLEVRYLSID